MIWITTINANGIRIPKKLIENMSNVNPQVMTYQWRLSLDKKPFIRFNQWTSHGFETPRKHITGYYIKSKFLKQIYTNVSLWNKVIIESIPGSSMDYYVRPL